jgi:two-component system nitrogen regulation sensor histidine kinase NtrY
VSAGIIGLDRNGLITLVNTSAADLLNIDSDELMGQSFEENVGFFDAVIDEAIKRPGEIAQLQIDTLGRNGAALNLNVRASVDEDGGIVVTFDDVSRLVTAQRNAAWRDVARRIAHEIKNPLTPIQLSAERLRRKYRDQVDEDGLSTFDRCVETIVRQVSDIGRMVDEFSSFARMPTPKVERVNLIEIANSAVFAQRVASPSISIPLKEPDDEILVECDSRLCTQALANLLKNAAESVSTRVEQDGRKPDGEIKVSVYRSNGFGVINVKDNGLGWPVSDKDRLTEPYMTTREKGTGLGLAIVRRVMEDHGGRLELDDPELGEGGAIVRLAFPLLGDQRDANYASDRAEA